MVGGQPGAERPTDRERKRAGGEKGVGERLVFYTVWVGFSAHRGVVFLVHSRENKRRRGGQGVVVNGCVSRMATVTTLLSSRGPVLADVVCRCHGTRLAKSSEERRDGVIWGAVQQVIWHLA